MKTNLKLPKVSRPALILTLLRVGDIYKKYLPDSALILSKYI